MAPTPSFEITSDARQSWIRGTIDGIDVTRASFKECADPYRRELIQIDNSSGASGASLRLRFCGTLSRQSRQVR